MARQGALAVAVLPLAALAQAAPRTLAVAERRLQQSGQPAYCDGITTNFNNRDWENNLNQGGGLTFFDVARQSDNTPLNLVVTNTTRYVPVAATDNPRTSGLGGQNIGRIAMNLNPFDQEQKPYGQCYNFHYENSNGNRVDPGDSILTFLDADNLQDGCREVYRICDSNIEFLTSSNSGLTRTSDGTCTEFSSQTSNVNNPTNSQALTSQQQAAGFGVRFSNSLNVCMRFEGELCDSADRYLMFSGQSNIDNCPSTSSTSSSGSTGTASTATPAACSSTCTFSGRTATCQELFSSVQSNGVPGSSDSMLASSVPCANAWATVVDSCNVCGGCSLSHVCQGMFELGPSALPRPAAGSRAVVVAVAGLSACLVALAAALALGRSRPAPVATEQGVAEAEPMEPLVQELCN